MKLKLKSETIVNSEQGPQSLDRNMTPQISGGGIISTDTSECLCSTDFCPELPPIIIEPPTHPTVV